MIYQYILLPQGRIEHCNLKPTLLQITSHDIAQDLDHVQRKAERIQIRELTVQQQYYILIFTTFSIIGIRIKRTAERQMGVIVI